MMLIAIFAFIGIGLIAGAFSGFLGCSSGIIVVPLLLLSFRLMDFQTPHLMSLTVGTVLSLGALALCTATLTQIRHFTVNKKVLMIILLGAALAYAPVFLITEYLNGKIFRILFGLLVISLPFIVYQDHVSERQQRLLRHPIIITLLSTLSHFLGMTFGIGGGILFTAVLKRAGLSILEAFGNISAAETFVLLVFSLGYMLDGWHQPNLPAHSLGFIYLPALVGIGIPCLIMTSICTRLRRKCSAQGLKTALCVILVLIGIYMLINAIFFTKV